jgi:RNA polymerase sigma-70 factor (ECF subfamily)
MPQTPSAPFAALITPLVPMLFRVAYRLVRNTQVAQDLVQDTCVAACEHAAALEVADHPARWLLRVLNNRFIDGARRARLAQFVPLDDTASIRHLASELAGPEQLQQQDDQEKVLQDAFLQLDPIQRTLLTLRAEGYGLGEIETITGIGRQILRSRLHRARRSLAERLDQSAAGVPCRRTGSTT